MNNLSKTLLGGVAICALATVPAVAGRDHHAMHVSAIHAGHAVNKTSNLHHNGAQHVTYTFGVYSSQPASAAAKTHLIYTYYKWNSNGTLCSQPKMKIKAQKKSTYAKIGTASETYSLGCPSGPTVFLGDTWTNKKGKAGQTDSFVSTLLGNYKNGSTKYKGTLNLDVSVAIN